MKRFFYTILIATLISCSSNEISESEVPPAVMESFKNSFKNVEVDCWSKEEDGNYEAEFKVNKIKTSANFSPDGTLMETEEELSEKSLPKSVTDYLKTNYPKHKIKEIAKVNGGGKVTYLEVEVLNDDDELTGLYFDIKGNLVEKKLEENDD